METPYVRRLKRRDLLKFGGAFLVGGAALRPTNAFGQQHGFCPLPKFPACGIDEFFQEFYPTSPFILYPFTDKLPVPEPLHPVSVEELTRDGYAAPHSGAGCQASDGHPLSTHQIWPDRLGLPSPLLYRIKLEVAEHSFTSSKVLPIDASGNVVVPPDGIAGPRSLPNSTIWGYNGKFPGSMINAEYHKPVLVRFENHLNVDHGLDSGDFGAPCRQFLTHLHNAHTAPESDGNPNYRPHGFETGEWVDNLYLNYPPDNDDREKQAFWWFHDHFEGYTGANVYKGLVGLMPVYDRKLDSGDETDPAGLRLPGVRTNYSSGAFKVDYDIPLALFDCRLDDGTTPHKDFHNGCSETHNEEWGRTFFRHFPNHGFVGDVFTVNGKAYPYLEVERRKYRLRFLDASIARGYELVLMRSTRGPKAARGTQGQWLLPDGERCMRFTQIASEGGLLPFPVERRSIVLFPAKRREVVVDFSKYMDGWSTKPGDEIYLVNTLKMEDGRKPDSDDPDYKVPILKFVVSDKATLDNSIIPSTMRELPVMKPVVKRRTFELERGSIGDSDIDSLPPELQEAAKEYEWSINSLPFNPEKSLAFPMRDRPEIWTIKSGGGWSHPIHFHQEEHQVLSRNGVPIPRTGPVKNEALADDMGKEDTVQLTGSETVVLYRNFRTFPAFGHREAKYVAHCHNLAHEDHSMMFGFTIVEST
jgi:FtsP/CotA-like multicopper oxidase with cupredoxin domain